MQICYNEIKIYQQTCHEKAIIIVVTACKPKLVWYKKQQCVMAEIGKTC